MHLSVDFLSSEEYDIGQFHSISRWPLVFSTCFLSETLRPCVWNVRSMNQGKLEVVARVNIGILGISELKWIGMGEFNSDDH